MPNKMVCPHCRGKLQTVITNDLQRCPYCGVFMKPSIEKIETTIPTSDDVIPPAEEKIETTIPTPDDAIPPAEYAKFKRPWLSPSLEDQSNGWGCVVLTMITIMIIALIWFGNAIGEKTEYDRLKGVGQTTQAMITKLTTSESDDSTYYYAEYEYKAPVNGDPTIFRQREEISNQAYNSFHIEQKLQVIYDPSNPNIAKLAFQFAPPNLGLYGALSGFVALFGGLISLISILVSLNARQNLKRLSLHGQYTNATIFARWEKKDSENNQVSGFVAFAFKIPTPEGKMKVITRAEKNNAGRLHLNTKC